MESSPPFPDRKDDLLSRKIISLESVFRLQCGNTRVINFFFLFSLLLIGRKIKVLKKLFPMTKCTCDLFRRPNKSQSGQNNQPQSRRNQSFFFSVQQRSTTLSTDRIHIGLSKYRGNGFKFTCTAELNDLLARHDNTSNENK